MEPPPRLRLALEWLLALAVTALAGFIFLNASFFNTYNAVHIDLSINLVASDALLDGEVPYGAATLAARAERLGSPTQLIYTQLFTSYIQPPTSAMLLTPLTALRWRDATRVALVCNHIFLLAAAGLTLYTLRPALPLRWTIAGAAVIIAAFNQVYSSFVLGQWDATILLLLAIAFWASVNRRDPVAGGAIALAAAIKLIPALLLLYFLWRGRHQVVLWGAGVGLALFLASVAYAGVETWRVYLTDTVPALLKGSTHYSNNTLSAVIVRLDAPSVVNGLPEVDYLGEVPSGTTARLASTLLNLGVLGLVAAVLGRPRREAAPAAPGRAFVEFYLVVAMGLMISSVTWEFYVVWLLPVFLVAFLSPGRILPDGPMRWLVLAALALAFVGLNYPADFYLFPPESNLFNPGDAWYHRDWVPGIWVEGWLPLYHRHLDAVLLLRLPSLLLCVLTLGGLVLWHRRRTSATTAAEAVEAVPVSF